MSIHSMKTPFALTSIIVASGLIVSPVLAAHDATNQLTEANIETTGYTGAGDIDNQVNLDNTIIYEDAYDQNFGVNVNPDNPYAPDIQVIEVEQGQIGIIDNTGAIAGTINNEINQENNIFYGPRPTPTPTPTPEPKVHVNDKIYLSITDGQTSTRPGGKFTYRISAKNTYKHDVFISTLRVTIPEFTRPINATTGASESPTNRTIAWHNFDISADSEITFNIDVEVSPNAPHGFTLIAPALLNGDGVYQSAEDHTDIYNLQAIAAAQILSQPEPAIIYPAPPYPGGVTNVPVTAQTGASSALALASPLITALGAFGLRRFLL